MSEVDIDVTSPADAPGGPRADFGARLTAARERRGWSINEVAARVRLSTRQVSALERQALDELPAPVFVRGFLRTYAREVGLDPAPLLDDFNALVGAPTPAPAPTPSAPSMERSAVPAFREAARDHYARPVVLGGALVLLVALGVIGAIRLRTPATPAPAPVTTPAPATSPTTPAVTPPAPPSTAAAPAGASADSAAPAEPPPVNVSAPIAAAPDAAPATTVTAPPATAAATPTIRLTFTEVSWVEIVDASGKVLMSQNNPAGTEAALEGRAPFQVLIGNAGATRLEYRGKPVELGPMTSRDNVARVRLD